MLPALKSTPFNGAASNKEFADLIKLLSKPVYKTGRLESEVFGKHLGKD